MKKYLLTLAVCFLMIFNVAGQSYLGIKGGIGFLSMTRGGLWDKEYDHLSRVGGNVGIAFEYVFSDYFSFYPQMTLARKGSAWYKKVVSTRTDHYMLNYLELPLALKGRYSFEYLREFTEIYGFAGPQLSFLVGGTASEQGTSIIGLRELPIDEFFKERNQKYNKFDAGLVFGAGATFGIGPGRVLLEFSYDISFLNIAEDDSQTVRYKALGSHRAFSMFTGYMYAF